jgi:hypothetical protein
VVLRQAQPVPECVALDEFPVGILSEVAQQVWFHIPIIASQLHERRN